MKFENKSWTSLTAKLQKCFVNSKASPNFSRVSRQWDPGPQPISDTALTISPAVAHLQVAGDADGGDGEHAAQAKGKAAKSVVNASDVLSKPGVVKGGRNGEWVEADAAEEVDHGQVDAQQLRAHHLLPPAVTDHENQPIAHNWEQN